MSSETIRCPSCGRPSDGRGTYCANCGAAVGVAVPAVPLPAGVAVVRPARRGGRCIFGLVVLAVVAAGVYRAYSNHGFERLESLLRPAYSPAVHGPATDLTQDSASPMNAPVGTTFDRVWVEGNTINADGYTGLGVHARVHPMPDPGSTFRARFCYSDGSPVTSEDSRYRDAQDCTATSAPFTPGMAGNEVSAFLPRGVMSLELGEHKVQVISSLLDGQGREMVTASPVNFIARRDPSYIARVQVDRAADPFGGVGRDLFLKVSFVLDRPLSGRLGHVVATFQDSRGVDVVGHGPYASAANVLTAFKEFRGPASPGNERYDDITVTIPGNLLPMGASALVFVEDPVTRKAVTEAVRFRLP